MDHPCSSCERPGTRSRGASDSSLPAVTTQSPLVARGLRTLPNSSRRYGVARNGWKMIGEAARQGMATCAPGSPFRSTDASEGDDRLPPRRIRWHPTRGRASQQFLELEPLQLGFEPGRGGLSRRPERSSRACASPQPRSSELRRRHRAPRCRSATRATRGISAWAANSPTGLATALPRPICSSSSRGCPAQSYDAIGDIGRDRITAEAAAANSSARVQRRSFPKHAQRLPSR